MLSYPSHYLGLNFTLSLHGRSEFHRAMGTLQMGYCSPLLTLINIKDTLFLWL
jgi:hypothetical protein